MMRGEPDLVDVARLAGALASEGELWAPRINLCALFQ